MNLSIYIKKMNKYSMLYCSCGLLLSIANPCLGADWASIKKTKDYELLVDMDSYNETAGMPFITAKTVFNKPVSEKLSSKKIVYTEAHSTKQFNCKQQLYQTLETYYFKNKSQIVGENKTQSPFLPLKKDSDNAAVASLVCQVHKMLGGS